LKDCVEVDVLIVVVVMVVRACGYAGAAPMCRPSLEPGGVSSAALALALAEAEAEGRESFAEGGYLLDHSFLLLLPAATGLTYCGVAELCELADAEILLFC
jgi:hypothetical protein